MYAAVYIFDKLACCLGLGFAERCGCEVAENIIIGIFKFGLNLPEVFPLFLFGKLVIGVEIYILALGIAVLAVVGIAALKEIGAESTFFVLKY